MPSAVAASNAVATTLPYFDVQRIASGPAAPSRCMPRGKAQRLDPRSVCQSMLRTVMIVSSGPR